MDASSLADREAAAEPYVLLDVAQMLMSLSVA